MRLLDAKIAFKGMSIGDWRVPLAHAPPHEAGPDSVP
jgi:hypothetical protein